MIDKFSDGRELIFPRKNVPLKELKGNWVNRNKCCNEWEPFVWTNGSKILFNLVLELWFWFVSSWFDSIEPKKKHAQLLLFWFIFSKIRFVRNRHVHAFWNLFFFFSCMSFLFLLPPPPFFYSDYLDFSDCFYQARLFYLLIPVSVYMGSGPDELYSYYSCKVYDLRYRQKVNLNHFYFIFGLCECARTSS